MPRNLCSKKLANSSAASKTWSETFPSRPRVAFLEWLQPFYVGGHWVPEMIELAGGIDVFGSARKPTFRVALQDIVEAAPDVMLISPCGYGAEQARNEYRAMSFPEQWNAIPAVRNIASTPSKPTATSRAPAHACRPVSRF